MPKVPGFVQPEVPKPNWELLAKHKKIEAGRVKRNQQFHLRPRAPKKVKLQDKNLISEDISHEHHLKRIMEEK